MGEGGDDQHTAWKTARTQSLLAGGGGEKWPDAVAGGSLISLAGTTLVE